MTKSYVQRIIGITAAFSLVTATAFPATLKIKDLPAAVQKTVTEQTKGAEIKGISKEVEKGVTEYEVETMVKGKSRDVVIDSKGVVLDVEEETELSAIPAPAKAALEKAAAGGKITKVETVNSRGKTTYEAAIAKGKKKSELVVDASGAVQK
ncbi:MAG: hypothetical protein ABI824_05490 [Acidobacteriota bacterium]